MLPAPAVVLEQIGNRMVRILNTDDELVYWRHSKQFYYHLVGTVLGSVDLNPSGMTGRFEINAIPIINSSSSSQRK